MRILLLAVVALIAFEYSHGLRGPFTKFLPKTKPTSIKFGDDPGEPLFLTPYLEQGKTAEARQLR